MINKYTLSIIILSVSITACAMEQSQQTPDLNEKEINLNDSSQVDAANQRLDRLREKFAIQKNLSPLHPIIKDEVDKAFKVCGITEPMIVLQNLNSTESGCGFLLDELHRPVKTLIIGVANDRGTRPLPLIRRTIFHECGHLVAGDVDQNMKKHIPFMLTNISLSTYVAIQATKILKGSSRVVRVLGGIGVGIMSLFGLGKLYKKTIVAYESRKIEYQADVFAAQKLINLHDYYALAYNFIDFAYNYDKGYRNSKDEYWFFHDHPGYIERARIILDELKKANIDFNNLPLDSHEDNQEIQQRFSDQVKKYFPEFMND